MKKYIKPILLLVLVSLCFSSCTGTGEPVSTNEVFQISSATLDLNVGVEQKLTAKSNINPDPQVLWTSSNPTVATVSEDGVVAALAIGTTVISAKSELGSIKYCVVNVVPEKYDFDKLVEFTIRDLPTTVRYYSKYTGKLISEYVIESFSLQTYDQGSSYIVYVELHGTKTYDIDGENGTNPILISTSLYREGGEDCNVHNFKKETSIKVGESFTVTLDPFQVLISYEKARELELKIDALIEQ